MDDISKQDIDLLCNSLNACQGLTDNIIIKENLLKAQIMIKKLGGNVNE